MTRAFLTIDTELAWRHHAAGLPLDAIVERSLEPAGVGVSWQLARLAEYGLKATFFVDPMAALTWGIEPIRDIVSVILAAGQEVQLHLHPHWLEATGDDRARHAPVDLVEYPPERQAELIAQAETLLMEAGAPQPNAFRSGSYAASDNTLRALAERGYRYESSHNGAAHPWPSAIDLPPDQIAPVKHCGVIEVPVTVIRDGAESLRHFQICALSVREMRDALDHAIAEQHATVTIVGHSFEMANRAGTRPNRVHVRRFEALCRMLAKRRDTLPTTWFAERPHLVMEQEDDPLEPNLLRTGIRQAEQLWSNIVEERPA